MDNTTRTPACGFSADTEILTRRGWVPISHATYFDEVAVRAADGSLDWEQPTAIEAHKHSGDMITFRSRTLSLLVAPSHRMLTSSRPRGVPGEAHGGDWLVRADLLAERGTTAQAIPLAAANRQPDLPSFRVPSSATAYDEYVSFDANVIEAARVRAGLTTRQVALRSGCTHVTARSALQGKRVRLRTAERLRALLGIEFATHSSRLPFTDLTANDFAAFMGAWLAEGSVTWHGEADGRHRPTIYISQQAKSRGYEPYEHLLARMLGRNPARNRNAFYFRHAGLAEYLRKFGHAHQKYVPAEIKRMSARQLKVFWHYYWLGDGDAERPRISTVSAAMADDLQQVALLSGRWATIQHSEPRDGTLPGGRRITADRMRRKYTIALHENPGAVWRSVRVPYEGLAYRVSVPTGTVYVRRNGKPAWSGA